jgi:hypothetical protein
MAGPATCEPRFATPRDKDFPTYGPVIADVAKRLGRELMPWQREAVDVAYEYVPDDHGGVGKLRYDESDIVVNRQAGKTTLVFSKSVTRLTKFSSRLGRQRSLYTSALRAKARAKLEFEFAPMLRESRFFFEVPHPKARPQRPTQWKLALNNGAEHIQIGRNNYLQIDAPSRTGGHGETLDDVTIDEAFAHHDDTVEAGVRPTMITRFNRQLWVLSTAGDEHSAYLYRKVLAGRAATETGRHGSVCYLEFSAEDDADPGDPRTWRRCMPALGITVDEETIRREWETAVRGGQKGIDTFRRSYLNQWPKIPMLDEIATTMPFDERVWLEELADPLAQRARRFVFGVDVGMDRLAHIAAAWKRPDGHVQVMLTVDAAGDVDTGLSPLATPARLKQLAKDWKGTVWLGGTSASLEGDVPRARLVSAGEFAAACGRFDDLFRERRIHHGNQPELNEAVRTAMLRAYGQQGERTLQLRDAPTVGPLAAVVRALHGLLSENRPPPAAPAAATRAASRAADLVDVATVAF